MFSFYHLVYLFMVFVELRLFIQKKQCSIAVAYVRRSSALRAGERRKGRQ